jgi:hypothetical protein
MNLLLGERGHTTAVLTSRYRVKEAKNPEPGVFRWLRTDSEDLAHYRPATLLLKPRIDQENRRSLEKIIDQFRPDVILIHSMWNLPKAVAWHAERLLPGRVVYYIASAWPYRPSVHEIFWSSPTRRTWMLGLKKILSAAPLFYLKNERRQRVLKFEHVLCVSQAVREDLARQAGISAPVWCITASTPGNSSRITIGILLHGKKTRRLSSMPVVFTRTKGQTWRSQDFPEHWQTQGWKGQL